MFIKWVFLTGALSSLVAAITFSVGGTVGLFSGVLCWGFCCAWGRVGLGKKGVFLAAIVIPLTVWVMGIVIETATGGSFSITLPVGMILLIPVAILEWLGWMMGRFIF